MDEQSPATGSTDGAPGGATGGAVTDSAVDPVTGPATDGPEQAAAEPADGTADAPSPYAATPAPGFRGGKGPGGLGIRGRQRFAALLRAATIAATVAMPVNIGIYLAAQSAGADFRVTVAGTSVVQHVGLAPVVIETLIAILFGTLMLWPMTYLRGGLLIWTILAVVVGVGSTLIPLNRTLDTGSGLALAAMHLVTLLCTLGFVATTVRRIGYE